MRSTIRHYFGEAFVTYEEKPREQWLFDFMAQVSLCGTQIWWTTEVNMAFSRLEEGYDNALKDYYKKQLSQLSTLISLLIGELSKQDRQKIMTICTIDVHSRDVVGKMIQGKVEAGSAFQWQSQLRHRCRDYKNHLHFVSGLFHLHPYTFIIKMFDSYIFAWMNFRAFSRFCHTDYILSNIVHLAPIII